MVESATAHVVADRSNAQRMKTGLQKYSNDLLLVLDEIGFKRKRADIQKYHSIFDFLDRVSKPSCYPVCFNEMSNITNTTGCWDGEMRCAQRHNDEKIA